MRYLSEGSQDPVTYMEVTETVGRFTRCLFSLWFTSRLPGGTEVYLRLACNMLVVQGILSQTRWRPDPRPRDPLADVVIAAL